MSSGLVHQSSLIGGIALGQEFETWAGLRAPTEGSARLFEVLSTYGQVWGAGVLAGGILGHHFARWEGEMQARVEQLARSKGSSGAASWLNLGQLHPASASVSAELSAQPTSLSIRSSQPQSTISIVKMEGGVGEPTIPEIRYPPEVLDAWERVEARWLDSQYYEGSRADLAQRRPHPDDVDTIWSHQTVDYAERIGAQVEIADIGVLCNEFDADGQVLFNPDLFHRVITALGERGREGSPARRLVRVRLQKDSLARINEHSYLSLTPVFEEVTDFTGRQVILTGLTSEGHPTFDAVALSFLEALYQEVMGGPEAIQFHEVPGHIPRDRVMALRKRRVCPVGMGSQVIAFLHTAFRHTAVREIHPHPFGVHDACFHGRRDAIQPDPFPEIAGWLYDGLARRLPPGKGRESLLDQLSDSKLGGEEGSELSILAASALKPLEEILNESQRGETVKKNRIPQEELRRVLDAYRALIVEEGPSQPHLAGKEEVFLKPLDRLASGLRKIQAIAEESRSLGVTVPPPVYNMEMLDILAQIEARMLDPDYFEGTREDLLRRRADLRLVDDLWIMQGRNFANLIPSAEFNIRDAKILLEPAANRHETPDRSLIETAIARLGEGDAASAARRVLEINVPAGFVLSELFDNYPELQFLATMPFVFDFEKDLKYRIQLIDENEGRRIYRLPTLSFLENLLQVAYGDDRVQLHPVLGVLPRDLIMRTRKKRVCPIGLSFSPIYFEEQGGPIHAFTLTQDDALQHAANDAMLADGLPEAMAWFYTEGQASLPVSPAREVVLDLLSDLYLPSSHENPWENLSALLLEPIQTALLPAPTQGDAAEAARIREAAKEYFTAYEKLLRERVPTNLQLASRQEMFLQQLEQLREPLFKPSYFSGGERRVPRVIHSSSGQQYPYELILTDLSQIVSAQVGQEFPLAQRGQLPILAKLEGRMDIDEPDSPFPSGSFALRFILKEGETRGATGVVIEPEAFTSPGFETLYSKEPAPPMAAGAGSIILEWLAVQAALLGKRINLLSIGNSKILSILLKQNLFDPENTVIEACVAIDGVVQTIPLRDFRLSEAEGIKASGKIDFWNVRGKPHPQLWSAVSVTDPEELETSSVASPVSSLPPPPFPPEIVYPPEVEAAWRHLEERSKSEGYHDGNRDELRAKRADPEEVDKIWRFQLADFARRMNNGKDPVILDAEALTEPNPQGGHFPNPAFLGRASALLGDRGKPGSLARQIVRIEIPANICNKSPFSYWGFGSSEDDPWRHLLLRPNMFGIEKLLWNKAIFVREGESSVFLDMPSLSLLEALYQTAAGTKKGQFHYVLGEIPRDTTMRFRGEEGVILVGFARGLILLRDVNFEVHPVLFTAHDAFTHGAAIDLRVPDPDPEMAAWLYRQLQRRLPPGELKERLLDDLADLEIFLKVDGDNLVKGARPFAEAALKYFDDALETALRQEARQPELREVVQAYQRLVREEFSSQPFLARRARFFIAKLREIERGLENGARQVLSCT
jgi:hypothetical protein